MNRGNRDIW